MIKTCHRGLSATVQIADRSHRGLRAVVITNDMVQDSPLRERVDEALLRDGTPIKVIRASHEVFESSAIISPLQRISSPRTLEVIRAGYFKAEDDIQGGDLILDIKRNKYYIYLAENEYEKDGETVLVRAIVAKCSHTVDVFRKVDKPTGFGGVDEHFEKTNEDIPVSVEFISAGIMYYEPGFFGSSTHRMFIQSSYGVSELDRVTINNDKFMVDAINSVSFKNTHQVTLSRDNR